MKAWICIGWEPLPSREPVCKKLVGPVTQEQAKREFKKKFPKLRNHTVHAE